MRVAPFLRLSGVFVLLLLCMSCAKLLPSSKRTLNSPWTDYESAKRDYMKIVPGVTTLADLKKLGFDPNLVPNIRIMSTTEVIGIFIPNSSIAMESLAPGIQECIHSKDRCTAYMIEPSIVGNKRTGNFWADFFTFKRVTNTSGWKFRGLIAIVDDVVSYRDPAGGQPLISEEEIQKKPLGPLQEIGGIVQETAQSLIR